MMFLLDWTIKISVIFAVALLAMPLLRRQSAALRHWILSAAVVCAALMPILSLALPPLEVRLSSRIESFASNASNVEPATKDAQAQIEPTGPLPIPTPPSRQPANIVAVASAVWIVGGLFGFLALAFGAARLAWIASKSEPIVDPAWDGIVHRVALEYGLQRSPRLLRSSRSSILATWGVIGPKIVLPFSSAEWSEERIDVVLAHELAHVRRGDWLIQILAEMVRAFFWFNPLAWIVCVRLVLESERACDDAVLNRGLSGSAYAVELLALARSLHSSRRAWAPALMMARTTTLERRLKAILDPHLNRRRLTRWSLIAPAVASVALALPVAAFHVRASAAVTKAEVPVASVISTTARPAASTESAPVAAARTGATAGQIRSSQGAPGQNVNRGVSEINPPPTEAISGSTLHIDVAQVLDVAGLRGVVAELAGRVVIEGGGPMPANMGAATVFAKQRIGNAWRGSGVSIRGDGTFPLRLYQGDNEVEIEGIPLGYTVKSVKYGALDLLKNTLRLDQATLGDVILLTLVPPPGGSVAGVKVSGAVTNLPPTEFFPNPRVGPRVRLWVGNPGGPQLETPMNSDGTFEFPAVPPGEYEAGVIGFAFSSAGSPPSRIRVADRPLTGVVVALPLYVTVVGHLKVLSPDGQVVDHYPANIASQCLSSAAAGCMSRRISNDTIKLLVRAVGAPYSIDFGLPSNYAVKSLNYDSTDFLKTQLTIDGSVNPMNMDITLEYRP